MEKNQVIHSYLKTRYSAEESRDALYRAASAASDMNWSVMDATFQLGDKGKEDGLTSEVIENTIRRAFARDRRGRERKPEQGEDDSDERRAPLDLDAESRRLLESRRIDPDALSIPWPSDDWRRDLVKLLEAAFQPKETIDFKMAETPQAHREIVSTIVAQADNINKIMKGLDGQEGALISINATTADGAKDESWRFRYAVVDSPRMSLSKQLAFYKALNLPCVALVNSGANTVQAWVRIEANDSTEYNERVDFLYSTLEMNGFKIDATLKSPTLMVRMPGVLRQGKQQYLIGLNEGAKSWKEWQEWVDYCLDGNPLIELASYHHQAPSPDAPLIDNICKAGDLLVLAGPPKSGKSHALIDLALALCYGGEWLGNHTSGTDVLYVNYEQSKSAFLNRLYAVANDRNCIPSSPRLGILHLRGFVKSVQDIADFLVRRIEGAGKYEDHDYKAVIIDPIYALLKDPKDISVLSDTITSKTGAAVITALESADLLRLQVHPEGIIELIPNQDRPNIFQIKGLFKDFPQLIGQECTWQYPRFNA